MHIYRAALHCGTALNEELQINSEGAGLCGYCVSVVNILQCTARPYEVWFCSVLPQEINSTSAIVTLRNGRLST